MNTEALALLPGRCSHGWHLAQARLADCDCHASSEWSTFTSAIRGVVRDDGTVHQCDVRPRLRGRVEPKHIGSFYRRAKSEGLLVDTGEREQSDDVAGRNSDKLDRIYRLVGAA